MRALAAAGFHAVAPDMPGYGQTDAPQEIDQYTLLHLLGDMVGFLEALGIEWAVIAGHDWGAPVAWLAAQLLPNRFPAVIALSVPFRARGTVRPTTVTPQTDDAVWYQLYFQEIIGGKSQAPQAICELTSTNVSRNLILNPEKPPFDNRDLRRAVALTLDRKAFIDILQQGRGDIGATMLPPPEGLWGMRRRCWRHSRATTPISRGTLPRRARSWRRSATGSTTASP